jgi:hypothetical protein
VKHRLLELIHQKELEIGNRLTIRQIARGAGVSERLIKRWLDPEDPPTRFDSDVIAGFCAYFQIDIADLLYLEDEED